MRHLAVMQAQPNIDWSALGEPVARIVWGKPTKETPRELRWGKHGSRVLNRQQGTWFDHENNVGGGVLDLVPGSNTAEQMSWLTEHSLIDRAPRSVHSDKPRIISIYDYADERGDLLFQVVRYDPKDFRQRRPDGRGGWISSLGETRRVLYRLPELRAAIAFDEVVYVVEGEKDVDALGAKKLVATCNPGGAGKWRSEYSECLRGADVVIIGDNDPAGRNHAQQVAGALNGIAKRVRVVDIAKVWQECPEKGDISDWFEAGGIAEEFAVIVSELPDYRPAEAAASATVEQANSAAPEWPAMEDDAYYGLAGKVVRTIDPHTEADRVGILIQFLAYFGNLIGNAPYYQVEADRHHANLFSVPVGQSAKARKGTAAGRVRQVMQLADPQWIDERMKGGLSSGEGLINEVRDEIKKWDPKAKQLEVIDSGVIDKRLMVIEAEFGNALAVMERPGNTLSQTIRQAWDGHSLSTITKNSPLKATSAHISIIGHITEDELRARITRTDAVNGFANRFLFVRVRRSKFLPFGGSLGDAELDVLAQRVKTAAEAAKKIGRVTMTDAARTEWNAVYEQLSAEQVGLLGAITARAEAQVVRIALIYALLDGSAQIDVPHLEAALAVWEYCELSAAFVFGHLLGDPIADEIARALQHAGPEGMSRTAIRDLFGRNRSGNRIEVALALLATRGRARRQTRKTSGHPAEVWVAIRGG
jgi:hypothetical protein